MDHETLLCAPTAMFKNMDFVTAWPIAVYTTMRKGMVIQSAPNYTNDPDYVPPFCKEICALFEFKGKAIQDILSGLINPQYPHHKGINEYIDQFIPGTVEFNKNRNNHYTYGLRLRELPCPRLDTWVGGYCSSCMQYCNVYDSANKEDPRYDPRMPKCYLDQLKFIAEHLDPFNRRLQAITWIQEKDLPACIKDEMVESVPCLRSVHIRNLGNGYYEIWFTWRSRDLFKAYQWNLIGLVKTIDKLINDHRKAINEPPLTLIKVTDEVESLQIYDAEWDSASKVRVNADTYQRCVFI